MRYAVFVLWACASAGGCERSSSQADAPRTEQAPSAAIPGGATPDDAAPRLATPEDALAAFLSAWNLSVLPRVRESERGALQAIDRAMREAPEKLTARREPCREAKALVERINRETSHDFVVYGTLGDLNRDGDCWRVMYEGGMDAEAIGYLDPVSGRLLVVWRVPEG
ncbi:MAG: hypothetical protein HY905_06420 [Deltaproteobacteria bacterium]|nr:hypothetical protein [Deltaproteobacteria bacterium]